LLQYNRPIEVLTTPLIYLMMLKKLSLTLDRSEPSLEEYFVFTPLETGKETNYYGLRITPFLSSHSIPTIGAKFETTHSGRDYSIIFSGDTQALSDVRKMQKMGIVSHERVTEIQKIYETPVSLLLADGGEGQIHGDPADALDSPAERIVFMHMEKLPDRFAANFMTASSGKRFPVVRGETDYNLTQTIEFLLEYPLIGEMSIMSGHGQRNASVVADNPVIVTAIAESSFREYIQHQGLETELKSMWQNRGLLQNFPYLKPLQQPVIRELSRVMTLEHLPARTEPTPFNEICDPYGFIMPLGQELTVKYAKSSATIQPHEKPVMCQGNETLITETEFQYLLMSAGRAAELRRSIPAFRFFWEENLGFPIPINVQS
jgi:hypothetical protein